MLVPLVPVTVGGRRRRRFAVAVDGGGDAGVVGVDCEELVDRGFDVAAVGAQDAFNDPPLDVREHDGEVGHRLFVLERLLERLVVLSGWKWS